MWFRYSLREMVELFANSGDPDQTPHSAASDLGLHCLPITHLGSPDYNGLKYNVLADTKTPTQCWHLTVNGRYDL